MASNGSVGVVEYGTPVASPVASAPVSPQTVDDHSGSGGTGQPAAFAPRDLSAGSHLAARPME